MRSVRRSQDSFDELEAITDKRKRDNGHECDSTLPIEPAKVAELDESIVDDVGSQDFQKKDDCIEKKRY